MKTKKEIREAKRIKQAKYYANRTPEQKAKENEKARIYQAKRRELNKDKVNALRNDWVNSVFYVYKHTNSKGDIYIGSGNKSRPNDFYHNTRSKSWLDCFSKECNVTIISEHKTKKESIIAESLEIDKIGLQNLVNQRS